MLLLTADPPTECALVQVARTPPALSADDFAAQVHSPTDRSPRGCALDHLCDTLLIRLIETPVKRMSR